MPLSIDLPSELPSTLLPQSIIDALAIRGRRQAGFIDDRYADVISFAPRPSTFPAAASHPNLAVPQYLAYLDEQGKLGKCIACDQEITSGTVMRNRDCDHAWHVPCFSDHIYHGPAGRDRCRFCNKLFWVGGLESEQAEAVRLTLAGIASGYYGNYASMASLSSALDQVSICGNELATSIATVGYGLRSMALESGGPQVIRTTMMFPQGIEITDFARGLLQLLVRAVRGLDGRTSAIGTLRASIPALVMPNLPRVLDQESDRLLREYTERVLNIVVHHWVEFSGITVN